MINKRYKARMPKTNTNTAQSGNVLFMILIAVVLFGALGYAVTGMMRGSGGKGVSQEQAKIYAAEIIQYAQSVKDTIRTLQISNDCADEDISFENSDVTGYEHTPPAKDACKVFDNRGGGMNFTQLNRNNSEIGLYFTGASRVLGLGSAERDLVLISYGIDDETCKNLNKSVKINNSDTIPNDNVGYFLFTGAYSGSSRIIGDTATNLEGKTAGCYFHVVQDRNEFFYVLIAR